jgi:hypothetical protein
VATSDEEQDTSIEGSSLTKIKMKKLDVPEAELMLGSLAVEALQLNHNYVQKFARDVVISHNPSGCPIVEIGCQELELAIRTLEMYGVPRTRYKYVHAGINVLITRMSREAFHLQQQGIAMARKVLRLKPEDAEAQLVLRSHNLHS